MKTLGGIILLKTMKYKNKLKKLEARVKFYDSLPKNIQNSYMRPGSQHK